MKIFKYIFPGLALLLFFPLTHLMCEVTTDLALKTTTSVPTDESIPTNEPIPKGPFINMGTHIEDVHLVQNDKNYRKWAFNRIFIENRGVGVTFTLFESFIDSPILSETIYKKNKISYRVEAGQTKKKDGSVWLRSGKDSNEDRFHFKYRSFYYGIDDKGQPVRAEFALEQ